eukprot:IDg1742t1
MTITQPYLTQRVVDVLRVQNAQPAQSPYHSDLHLEPVSEEEGVLYTDRYPSRQAIGIFRNLADSTRPDLAYVVGALAGGSHRPSMRHWRQVN